MTGDAACVLDGNLLLEHASGTRIVPVGSEAWFGWLEESSATAFRYLQGERRFTARREVRRGQCYWYAYRRQDGRLRKRYLGRAAALTAERLAAAAAWFDLGQDGGQESTADGSLGAGAAIPERRHNLPPALTSMLGREAEIEGITQALDAARLVTLTGPGGIGKTRLALHAAATMHERGFDAVWLVELDRLTDPALVTPAIAQAVGVREEPGQPMRETLAAALGAGQVLLVVDNCEHLLEPCAHIAEVLLRSCPALRILATSREPLGLPSETTWPVPALELPPIEACTAAGNAASSPAVRLFVARAQAARPDFALTSRNAAAVVDICRRLDGMPLAIELAAARVRALSPAEIAARLSSTLRLTGENRAVTPRHRTLHAAAEWSNRLLSVPERRCFERLAVFAGGFSLDAAESVCAGEEIAADDVCHLVLRLVDRSLVVAEPRDDEPGTRYRLLEPLRAFANECLLDRGEHASMRSRHASWLCARAEEAARAFQGPDQGTWLRWAARERDNARAALAWSLQCADSGLAVRLAAAFSWPWLVQGHWSEGLEWAQRVLALPIAESTRARGLLLIGAMQFAAFRGDLASNRPSGDLAMAVGWVEECFRIGEALADDWLILAAGGTAEVLREFGAEVAGVPASTPEQGLAAARRVGDTWGERRALEALAREALRRRDLPAARSWLQRAIASAQRDGDAFSLAMALNELGDIERAAGAHARAKPLYEESNVLFVGLGLGTQPNILHNLGYIALASGEPRQATDLFLDALARFRRSGDRRGMAECLFGLGALAAAERRPLDAARLFGAGEAALEALGHQLWPANRPDYERWLARAKSTRSTAAFDRTWEAGRATPLPTAVGWILDGVPPHDPRSSVENSCLPLTRREREVARLAARGLTNRQIGEALAIAEKTAANHVQRVLEKLDLRTRTQLAARASALGLDVV